MIYTYTLTHLFINNERVISNRRYRPLTSHTSVWGY
uniref:Uncharacterized protein n=1 Tax=Anguilla anguilla TaxID=7936 RepID=A0A0E9PQ70_ANGAN